MDWGDDANGVKSCMLGVVSADGLDLDASHTSVWLLGDVSASHLTQHVRCAPTLARPTLMHVAHMGAGVPYNLLLGMGRGGEAAGPRQV